jgi:hypothetical protein
MWSAPSRGRRAQSSMARSGSGSRTSRGVSSCSAAVRTPTFMNLGSNGVIAIVLFKSVNDATGSAAGKRIAS